MAWRIDEHVIRGEIDNRRRGRVTGRIWFAGRNDPVELELTGDAWRDVAGRRLEFTNPDPKPGLDPSFAAIQRGAVGDITASRKVKVPEIPMDQIGEYYAQRKPWPWHWGNCLYLEWFSERNGRVVIESAHFQLTVAPEITWQMTEEEELEQRHANAEAMTEFMGNLADSVERTKASEAAAGEPDAAPPHDAESATEDDVSDASTGFSESRPQTEDEADRMLADSDKLSERIAARMEREGPDADFDRILEEELERRRRERDDPPLTPEQETERSQWIEEANRAAETAADDPELQEIVSREHPLAERAQALALHLASEPEDRGWIGEQKQSEHPIVALMEGGSSAAGKFAAALNGREWPPTLDECGLAISWLKRARSYLDDALAAADACAEDNLATPAWLAGIHAELTAIATEADALIADLRSRLARGFD